MFAQKRHGAFLVFRKKREEFGHQGIEMAIEFLRAQVLTRGGVNIRGVPAHMAYRSCSKIYDERQNRTFDYRAKLCTGLVFG